MAINIFALAGLAVLTIGLLLDIVGLATPEWIVGTIPNITYSQGLWEYCLGSTCESFPEDAKATELELCKTFSIIGMLAGLGALAIASFHFVMNVLGKPQNILFAISAAASSGGSMLIILVTLVVYGVKIYGDAPFPATIGYSFALSIVGAILIPIGGSIFCVASKFTRY